MIIVSYRSIEKQKKLLVNRSWQWAYLGTDMKKKGRMSKALGEAQRFGFARELQQIIKENRQSYIDRLGIIGQKQKEILYWWATRIASKSPYQSDLFLNCCYLELLKKWYIDGREKLIVIVENPSLVRAASAELDTHINMVLHSKDGLYKRLDDILWRLGGTLFFVIKALCWWGFNLFYRIRYRSKNCELRNHNYDVMIYSWIENRSFDRKKGTFTDHYFGPLAEIYRQKGFYVARVAPAIINRNFVSRLYKAGEDFILLSSFLRLYDILRVLLSTSMLDNYKSLFKKKYDGFAVLYNSELAHESYICRWSLLCYYINRQFWRHYTLKINKTFIYPFENQPWEKMLLLSLQELKRSFSIVGYQHSTMPEFLLNYYIGKDEDKFMPLPDILVANGSYHLKVLKSLGYPCTIKNGGSLRYSNKARPVKKDKISLFLEKEKNVLVLLGPIKIYTFELIVYILKIASEIDKKFLLKPHPDLPASHIKKWIKCLPSNVMFVDGPLELYFDQVAYVIHIGTTAALECFQQNMKIFKYLPEIIDLDPLSETEIPQDIITWEEIPSFKPSNKEVIIKADFISEPIKEETWFELVF